MGFLRALGRASFAARKTARWRSGSVFEQCIFLENPSWDHHRDLKAVQLGAARGVFCNAGNYSKAGTFSSGKFTAESSENEATSAAEDEDADPDAELGGALSPAEFGPFNKLFAMFMENPNRLPGNMITEWEESGNKFTRDTFIRLFRKLRSRRRDGQVHRLMLWILSEKPITITSRVYQYAIMGAHKVRKLHIAKKIYESLSPEQKTPALCTSMVTAFASKNEAEKAEQVMEGFKPVTAQSFNSLMLMYLRMSQDEKAMEVYHRLRKAGVKPSDLTFFILAKYRRRLGIEINKAEADAVLNECLEGLDMKRDGLNSASNVVLAYAHMGDEKGVLRGWAHIEQMDNVLAAGNAVGIEAFGLLGKMDKVKLLAKQVIETKRRDKSFYPALIRAYAINGMMDRAVGIIDNLKSRDDTPIFSECYDELIYGYIISNEPKMAIEKAKESLECVPEKRVKPSFLTLKSMLTIYKQFKDVSAAEALFLKYKGWRDASVFNDLLKVYVEAEIAAPNFEQRMRKVKVKPDEETKLLLERVNAFSALS